MTRTMENFITIQVFARTYCVYVCKYELRSKPLHVCDVAQSSTCIKTEKLLSS